MDFKQSNLQNDGSGCHWYSLHETFRARRLCPFELCPNPRASLAQRFQELDTELHKAFAGIQDQAGVLQRQSCTP